MKSSLKVFATLGSLVFIGLVSSSGCNPAPEVTSTKPASDSGVVITQVSQEASSRLEQADALDGKSDHVIGKCYVCSLGMDGKEKYSVKVGEYTAHLCSKGCQEHFSESSEEVILKTEVPKKDK